MSFFLCPNRLLSKKAITRQRVILATWMNSQIINILLIILLRLFAIADGRILYFIKKLFQKISKTNVHFEVRWFEGLRKGTFQTPPLSRQRKEVRT